MARVSGIIGEPGGVYVRHVDDHSAEVRYSKGAVERAERRRQHRTQLVFGLGPKSSPVPHQFPASVMKGLRRMHNRIRDGRWSGMPK